MRRAVIGASLCAMLAGCSHSGMGQLQQFVAHADANVHPRIMPVPTMKAPKIVAFNMGNFADPFEPFAARRRPLHFSGPEGPLQHYPLADLTMVGTLTAGHKRWAIIVTPNGITHRVTIGAYMGEHYGRVVRITAKSIRLVQIVAGPTGWVQQPVKIGIK